MKQRKKTHEYMRRMYNPLLECQIMTKQFQHKLATGNNVTERLW